jgi:signal transduction histidine kinase
VLFGKFRILGKLALLVIVPLLGVVALSVPVIVNRISAANDAQNTSNMIKLAARVGTAVQELQEERLLSVGYRLFLVDQSELVQQSARAVDAIAAVDDGDVTISRPLRRALTNTSRLANTRQNVLNQAIAPNTIVEEFTSSITPVINALALTSNANLKTGVGRQIYALDQALRSDDLISQAAGYLTAATATKNIGLIGLFSSTLVQISQVITNGQAYFTDAQYKLYLGTQAAFSSRVGSSFLVQAVTDPAGAVQQLHIETLFPSLRSVLVLGGFVEKRVAADVNAIVTQSRDNAIRDAILVGGGSLLLLIVVILLSVFMSRAVARPLRRLTASADRIARAAEAELERVADDDTELVRPIRLDQVDVEARDEIGDLARAFDRVQTTAARLVERQVLGRRHIAQMFGHVGRRTQNLVGRQLALIDTLERKETDSDRLGDLYRLDHMSSRLRRNASSLVVLSGGAGTNEHMAPLPLQDVVRLALGEIEDYTRVDVDVPEEIVVVPAVLADLTLLLAELMENATAFSPPQTRVVVTAEDLRGGARLAIIDNGLGLAPERLAEENARLTRRERLDLAPTEVLGLFVVGRLARRHGIEVTLTDSPGGGVTAWVDLTPAHLISRVASTIGQPPPFAVPGSDPALAFGPGHHTAELTQVLAGSAARSSVPGSQQPFDPNVLTRATQTLETGQTWNAFAPTKSAPAAVAAAPVEAPSVEAPSVEPAPVDEFAGQPVYDAEPVYSPTPAYQQPVPPYDLGTPVAGRIPGNMPELPAAGPGAWNQSNVPAWTTPTAPPAEPPVIPRQRVEEDYRYDNPPTPAPRTNGGQLRRRVPGNQLPAESRTTLPAAPPSQNDAVAARAAFEAFEAGVSRAKWDAVETDMSSPPSAGHPPLARRVPGATLPLDEPNYPPPASPALPLDPEEARALMEQFEYGVALALNETKPQPEGQPR